MRAVVFGRIHWLEEVIGLVGVAWLLAHLTVVASLGQIPVAEAREELVACDHNRSRPADEHLTSLVVCGPIYCLSDQLRLIDWWYWLRLARHFVAAPGEL